MNQKLFINFPLKFLRIYELQEYRSQIKNFLETHKPYFTHDGNTYFIEDIASYHIHAGDYFVKKQPRGGHSNFGGTKLDHLKPELIKDGPLGSKDVLFKNSRNSKLFKKSGVYPENWSEYMCDLKAIKTMMNDSIKSIREDQGIIEIIVSSQESLKIRILYDIKAKRIKTHYPDIT